MAHFHQLDPGATRVSGQQLTSTRAALRLGLWGQMADATHELDVVVDNPLVHVQRVAVQGDSRIWMFSASASCTAHVQARSPMGQVWDQVTLQFNLTAHPAEDLAARRRVILQALDAGRLQDATGTLAGIIRSGQLQTGGYTVTLTPALITMLAGLCNLSRVALMSVVRLGQGPHGRVTGPDTAECAAVDITAINGTPINLMGGNNAENAIAGVAELIYRLPPGEYAFGLPRPSVRANGPPMPDRDVFLPRNDQNWRGYRVGEPLHNPTPQFANPQARSAVDEALRHNPQVRVNRMFADGPDHLHLEVISAR